MTAQENIRMIKGVYDAFNRGDIQGLLAVLTDDVDWIFPGPAGVIPYAGRIKGPAAVSTFFKILAEHEEVQAYDPRDFIANKNAVVACGYYRSRIRATGRMLEGEWAQVWRLRAGKVEGLHSYVDTAAMVVSYGNA